jgi:hypothetical protein
LLVSPKVHCLDSEWLFVTVYIYRQAAVSYNHLELVQYLLDHGASAVLGKLGIC